MSVTKSTPERLRDRQAQLTRETILEAARRLFDERGYAATSMKHMAAAAGVAVQTIYDAYGSKANVLIELANQVDRQAGMTEIAQRMLAETEPTRLIGLIAHARRTILEQRWDVLRVARAGATVDADVAVVWERTLQGRHAALVGLMMRLSASGALRDGLEAGRAADAAAALCAEDVFEVLVSQRSWSFDDYEAWLATTLGTLVLRGSSDDLT